MTTPVLLIAHARPHETRRVVDSILSANAQRVYVATDGPRPSVATDSANCARVQEALHQAAWPGEVQYKKAEENLGPRLRIPSAIEWALREVDRLIVLEDDCLPHHTFFGFCEELLERYHNEPRVMMVTGTNPARWRGGPSYRFSTYGTTWGWATWASAWRHFCHARELVSDHEIDLHALAGRAWQDPAERRFWETIYRGLRDGDRSWSDSGWDYEWVLARVLNGGLAAMPRTNLVENIGFGAGATNTSSSYSHPIGRLKRGKIKFPLIEPRRLQPDARLDTILRAGQLEIDIPGFRPLVRRMIARVRGKIDAALQRNAFSRPPAGRTEARTQDRG